MCEETEAP